MMYDKDDPHNVMISYLEGKIDKGVKKKRLE